MTTFWDAYNAKARPEVSNTLRTVGDHADSIVFKTSDIISRGYEVIRTVA